MSIIIDDELCINCNDCVDICPLDVFSEGEYQPQIVYLDECWYCGACVMDCPSDAIRLELPYSLRPVAVCVK